MIQFILANPQVDTQQIRIWTRLGRKLTMLNIFDSESDDIHIVRRERYSTRIYLIVLPISMLIILLYMVVSKEIVTNNILTPTQAQYEKLLVSHYNTFRCPCTNISLPHELYMTANATFHQVCSSDFVKQPWIKYLFGHSTWSFHYRADIRVRGAAYFNLLTTLCMLSETTVNNSIDQFLKEMFISSQIMSESEFVSQMDIITQQFKTVTSARFSRTLQLLRDITHGNTFISSFSLNWYWWVNQYDAFGTLPTQPVTLNNGCSCGTRSDCIESGGIFYSTSNIQHFVMPGLYVGCSAVETLLRSTLECLFNQTCIDRLQYYAATVDQLSFKPINVTAMNFTIKSRFHRNTTLNDIINVLLVEQWNISFSYSAFYNQCAPVYCSYTFEKRSNFLFIISKVLGLYGGLTISLQFIIPYIVRLFFKIKNLSRSNIVTPIA